MDRRTLLYMLFCLLHDDDRVGGTGEMKSNDGNMHRTYTDGPGTEQKHKSLPVKGQLGFEHL